jgi:Ca2+-binding EF-hand superfamily protein
MEIHSQLNQTTFRQMLIKTFPEIARVITAKDGRKHVDECMVDLFQLMDADKDGFVDQVEMGVGLKKMFPTKWEAKQSRVNPATIFAKMDVNLQGVLFLSDV